jgi:hypothetical protein
MSYNFLNLSPADFEDLARDLIGREVGVRFEAFGVGPDGGIDGRHAAADGSIILQAKHYMRSTFSDLKTAMKKERRSIDILAPGRYRLATTRQLSPANKRALASVIGPALQDEADIFGAADLNTLLRKNPDIVRGHIKLWLSDAAVLERVGRSAAYVYTAMSRAEVLDKVNVYAQNPSFQQSRDKLEANHVLIISGPPGVGKTTLGDQSSFLARRVLAALRRLAMRPRANFNGNSSMCFGSYPSSHSTTSASWGFLGSAMASSVA